MQKRVLAINDISCVGRCSLTVALFLFTASGIRKHHCKNTKYTNCFSETFHNNAPLELFVNTSITELF